MPITKSAKKRVRVSAKATVRNRRLKNEIRLAFKSLRKSASSAGKSKDQGQVKEDLAKVYSLLDKAVKKNMIHKNKARRKKARINQELKKTK